MDLSPALVVRNALLPRNDATVDIAVDDGRIASIRPAIEAEGEIERDAEGNLVTEQGGTLLDLDGYALTEGTPANLVVHHEPSPQWAITTNRTPRYVVSAGEVVARDGTLQ